MDVSKLVDELGQLNKVSKDLYGQYKAIEEQKAEVRAALTNALSETGLRSAKTSDYTASMSTRQSVSVTNEDSAVQWVKENLPTEESHYIGLKTTSFKTLAMSRLKETGEIIPGTELIETESLAIKANKKGTK